MANTNWTNADGLQVRFGNSPNWKTFANNATELVTAGSKAQIEIDIDWTQIATGTTTFTSDLNNDGTNDGFNDGDVRLPANCSVTEVVMVAVVAATGGTSWTIGTYKKDGTAIGATSLMTATEGVIANQNAIGKRIYGAGSLVATTAGTAGVGTANAYIGITGTGTFTAGKSRLIITYVLGTAEAVAD